MLRVLNLNPNKIVLVFQIVVLLTLGSCWSRRQGPQEKLLRRILCDPGCQRQTTGFD